MQPKPPGTIEQALQQGDARLAFLPPAERAGRWRELFGEAAAAVPNPYWLYSEAEQAPILLGFPLRVSATWETFGRELTRLLEAEASYRRGLALHDEVSKAPLVEHRRLLVGRIAEILDNAYLHAYGPRLPEVFLLILTREISERLPSAVGTLATNHPEPPPRA